MPWAWKVPDRSSNERLNLRYEPGSLGDLVKGLWAVECARARLNQRAAGAPLVPFVYLDPFAGAPGYPLVVAARERLAAFAPSPFHELQQGAFARNEILSTAGLVAVACAEYKAPIQMQLFEADPKRRAAWQTQAGVERDSMFVWLEGQSGEMALELALVAAEQQGPRPDLILIDPYDFLKGGDWKDWFKLLVRAAELAPTLVYVFNRAPRSAGHWNNYRELRASLEREVMSVSSITQLCGRIPSDAVLPRAYHEMLLLGPTPEITALRPRLEELTRGLAARLARAGAFEYLELT